MSTDFNDPAKRADAVIAMLQKAASVPDMLELSKVMAAPVVTPSFEETESVGKGTPLVPWHSVATYDGRPCLYYAFFAGMGSFLIASHLESGILISNAWFDPFKGDGIEARLKYLVASLKHNWPAFAHLHLNLGEHAVSAENAN